MKLYIVPFLAVGLVFSSCSDPAQTKSAPETAAMESVSPSTHPLSFMFGEWRGTAKGMDRSGSYSITQTERVGPMLDDDLIIVEGRGYKEDGSLAFNAFGVISYDPVEKAYFINAFLKGRAGKYKLIHSADGFSWTIQAGPNAKIVNTAVITDGIWHEVTKYVPTEGPERITNDMTLTRIGDTHWPASGVVLPAK